MKLETDTSTLVKIKYTTHIYTDTDTQENTHVKWYDRRKVVYRKLKIRELYN